MTGVKTSEEFSVLVKQVVIVCIIEIISGGIVTGIYKRHYQHV